MKKLAVLIMAALFAFGAAGAVYPTDAWAKSSKSSGKSSGSSKKTVSVKDYKKKDGTRVKEHKRSAPRRK